MDNLAEGTPFPDLSGDPIPSEFAAPLSYDDTVAYEEQLPTAEELEQQERAATAASLANRIGSSKVYLLAESAAAARGGNSKRKHSEGPDDDTKMDEDDEMVEDLPYRPNAILITGTPIAHLPTTRIFAYATHFDAHPLGLEWVDDTTCVLVFDSRRSALQAFSRLQKNPNEEPDMEDCVSARPFPVALWPPEERIKQSVLGGAGQGQAQGEGEGPGLKGPMRMRWARGDDVKKKGAMKQSQFYKKHGASAGKELFNGRDLPPAKRRRREDGGYSYGHDADRERGREDDEAIKARLDDELEQFLAEDATDDEADGLGKHKRNGNSRSPTGPGRGEAEAEGEGEDYDALPPSPPSKMRSDYIADDGRTLLQRTSAIRLHNTIDTDVPDLAARITAPLPRRRRGGGADGRWRGESPIPIVSSLDDRLQSPIREKLEWGPSSDRDSRRRDGDGERRRRRRGPGGGGGGGGGWEREGERDLRPARAARTERPKKTQQELDDELDAFLRGS